MFYFGENLTNGRAGLVPSNFVERVPDHLLLQNATRTPATDGAGAGAGMGVQRQPSQGGSNASSNMFIYQPPPAPPPPPPSTMNCLNARPNHVDLLPNHSYQSHHSQQPSTSAFGCTPGGRAESPSFCLNVPAHHAQIEHDFTELDATRVQQQQPRDWRRRLDASSSSLPDTVCPYPPADISKVIVQEVKRQMDIPRAPRELNVEKRLSRSVVISWMSPDSTAPAASSTASISQYHVCVDGVVKAVVPATYKCKALIEDLNMEKSVNISVRAITVDNPNVSSPDAACTIAIGAEAPVAPQHVRVSNITPMSAQLSWYPSDSSAEHVLLLNGLKIGVCPPSVFQVQLHGLTPATIYRLSVRTKHPRAVLEKRPVERCIDFKTLPKIGLPDPPANVQVEVGPQPGTLLISWTPVTNQPRPPSRAAIHSYLIFADGRNIAQVPSSTADHLLLRLCDLADDPPIFITVRTRTREGTLSCDSNVVRVPRAAGRISIWTPNPSSSSNASAPPTTTGVINSTAAPILDNHIPPLGIDYSHPSSSGGLLTTAIHPTMPQHHHHQHQQQQQMYSDVNSMGQVPGPPPNLPPQRLHHPQQPPPLRYPMGAIPPPAAAANPSASPSSYYTFHPKALYTEFPTAATAEEKKPSVLEMENNYLLKHQRQQQQQWRSQGSGEDQFNAAPAPTMANRLQYYVNGGADRPVRLQPQPQSLPPPPFRQGPQLLPRRLARVQSEEQFMLGGTRSEPDLRTDTVGGGPYDLIGGDGPMSNSRWFVALYDYDHSMSPNPNAQQEELIFRKHQLIKVYGNADSDGFYYGEINRRFGLVPSNMVIEIAKDGVMPARRLPQMGGNYPQQGVQAEDPNIRRTRWGSLKSRSYDNPRERRPSQSRYAQQQQGVGGGGGVGYGRQARHSFAEPSAAHIQPGAEYDTGGTAPPPQMYSTSLDRDNRRERSLPPTGRYYSADQTGECSTPPRGQYSHSARTYGGGGGEYSTPHGRKTSAHDQQQQREYSSYEDEYPPPSRRSQPAPPAAAAATQMRSDYSQPPRRMTTTAAVGDEYPQQQQYNEYAPPNEGPPPQQQQRRQPPSQQQPQQRTSRYESDESSFLPSQQKAEEVESYPSMGNNIHATRKMIAKYDYNAQQLSPNVDAEQMELSFRQGDVITIFGEIDEDGFYLGQLDSGMRGLVPSNFLQPAPPGMDNSLAPPGAGARTLSTDQSGRPKGVVFSEGVGRRTMAPQPPQQQQQQPPQPQQQQPPTVFRQTSQGSNKVSVFGIAGSGGFTTPSGGGGAGMPPKKAIGASPMASSAMGAKAVGKKPGDLSRAVIANANATRKQSQAPKKSEAGKKKT